MDNTYIHTSGPRPRRNFDKNRNHGIPWVERHRTNRHTLAVMDNLKNDIESMIRILHYVQDSVTYSSNNRRRLADGTVIQNQIAQARESDTARPQISNQIASSTSVQPNSNDEPNKINGENEQSQSMNPPTTNENLCNGNSEDKSDDQTNTKQKFTSLCDFKFKMNKQNGKEHSSDTSSSEESTESEDSEEEESEEAEDTIAGLLQSTKNDLFNQELFKVMLINLHPQVTYDDVVSLFNDIGFDDIIDIMVINQIHQTISVVTFEHKESMERAVSYNDKLTHRGRIISIRSNNTNAAARSNTERFKEIKNNLKRRSSSRSPSPKRGKHN